jgi:large subunit ribosomal protein L10
MSKPVKELLRKELVKRLDGVTSVAVAGFTGLDAITTNNVRKRLLKKDIRMTVVKNSAARQAFKSIGLDKASDLLDGPCAIVYGADSIVTVVRELLAIGKDSPNLTVKAAYMEGTAFGQDQIERLSKFPTRDEAIALIVSAVLSPGGKLVGCLIGPSGKLASILKTIEEKALGGEGPKDEAAA